MDTSAPSVAGHVSPESSDIARQYAVVSLFLVPAFITVTALTWADPMPVARAEVLLGPVFGMAALTAVVFLLMLVARNAAIIMQKASIEYFRVFLGDAGPDWVERPARTFNNLMQVPTIFYVMCAMMMHTQLVDSVQVSLAWAFVTSRVLHAFVFVGWNDVKWRFATAQVGFVIMGILMYRFAAQSLPLWNPFDG